MTPQELVDQAVREAAEQTWCGPDMPAGSIMVLLGWRRLDLATHLVPAAEIRKIFQRMLWVPARSMINVALGE